MQEANGVYEVLSKHLEFLKEEVKLPVVIHVDNVGAMFMANNAETRCTKYIDTRYHLVREFIED